jgi:predicted nucleic acid-binding protein
MLVFDASAAVKWFKPGESGAQRSLELLTDSGGMDVWLPDNCAHEVLQQVARLLGPEAVPEAWDWLALAHVTIAHVDGQLVAQAALTAAQLGCTYYDALAPALANLLGGTLVSADKRAHGAVPGVILLG